MKNTKFKSTIAEINDIPSTDSINPFLTKIKFIFADNGGNENNEGIEAEDFDSIAQSAINMPIKMNYSEKKGKGDVEGHAVSVPIGHITSMVKEVDGNTVRLIGEALLYREEYPREVQFLKDKHASGEAPGISWELAYSDSILKDGINWLKQAVTMAATFVKSPAYGRRTQLLAIAQSNIDDEQFMTELKEIVDGWASNDPKGGNRVDEKELKELLEKAQAELKAATETLTATQSQLTEATSKIETLTTENETLKTENNEFKVKATLAERTAKIAEAGIKVELEGDALAAKQALWLSMSEEIFTAYVEDLAAASKAAPKTAAASTTTTKDSLPRFTAVAGQEITLDDLKSQARKASRGEIAEL